MNQPRWRLRVWTRFRASPEEVWAIKTDPDALAAEFRPFGYFSLSETERSMMCGPLFPSPLLVRSGSGSRRLDWSGP